MPEIPRPEYEYDIERLARAYRQAVQDILRELNMLDLTDISRANSQAALAHISEILKELDADSAEWLKEMVPKVILDGAAGAIYALGVVETFKEAKTIAKFNRLNRDLVKTVIADTQNDLLQVTQNIERKVRTTMRKVVADSLRANMAAGINGRRTISRDIMRGLKEQLGDSVNTGIISANGSRWRPEVYTDMVVRTKLMFAHIEATHNEGIARGALYGVISSHGAKDACKYHEGRIIRLTEDAPGDYPTYDKLKASNQIFHPNCRHVISVLRSPDSLDEDERRTANEKAILGDKAIATGKRNPQDVT